MSLALRWGDIGDEDSGFVYFDVVTSYSQNYSGSVTKHPIDGGGSIVDHFVRENPILNVSGVITGVDVSTGTFLLVDDEGNRPFNVDFPPTAVSVTSDDDSVLAKLIPASISQFLPDNEPEVIMDDVRTDVMFQVQEALKSLMVGQTFNEETQQLDNKIQLVTLYEYEGSTLVRATDTLVITNITFNEDADSGQGLFFDMTLEKVTFASLKLTPVPADIQSDMAAVAAEKDSEGRVDSTPQEADEEEESRLRELREKIPPFLRNIF